MKFSPVQNPIIKLVYLFFGIIFLIAGVIGLLLPILPGWLFFIPAVICFAKASGTIHKFLSRSKRFGKYFN